MYNYTFISPYDKDLIDKIKELKPSDLTVERKIKELIIYENIECNHTTETMILKVKTNNDILYIFPNMINTILYYSQTIGSSTLGGVREYHD